MLFSAASLTPAFAQNAPEAAPTTSSITTSQPLNIKQIHDKLEAAGYTDITEIERDRTGYEAKARNKEGQRIKIDLDLTSGDILKTKVKSKDR
jgi:hypothetical protein